MKTEQEINELLEYALTLYQNNVSSEEVKKAMIRQGADEELADEIVKAREKKGKYFLILGAILLAAGLINSISNYQHAAPRETFKIFPNMIIVGAISILRFR